MKSKLFFLIVLIVLYSCTNTNHQEVKKESQWESIVNAEFIESYPTQESVELLYDEMIFQRATQSVLWSLPAMTVWYMRKGSEAQFGEGSHILPIWKDKLNAKTLVSTPNSDVIYYGLY
jgi:hypothetical protein